MSVAERIKEGRKAKGWSQARLAKELGVSRVAIIQWENPETTPKLKPHIIIKLAELFNAPKSAFAVFGGDTVRTTADTGRHAILLLRWRDLPNVGDDTLLSALKKPAHLEVSKEISKKALALTIEDDSMVDEFMPGEEIVIDPDVRPEGEDDFVLARLANGEHLFRRYRPRGKDGNSGAYDLVAENPHWKTVSVTAADAGTVRILGTMVEHRRKRSARKAALKH